MVVALKIFEQQIIDRDTSAVRKEIDTYIHASNLIKKHENDVSIIFHGLTPYDIMKKLKKDEYRDWFKKLDREVPALPYFLNEASNSLLFFLMGNIPYDEKESSVEFSPIEASRFFREKVIQMKNLCLPHNINPQPGITRVSEIIAGKKSRNKNEEGQERNSGLDYTGTGQKSGDSSSESKKGAIKDFLDKLGSIAFLNSDRTVKLTLVLNDIPEKISFAGNFLVKDPKFPQQFFLTLLKTGKDVTEIKSHILANFSDVESSVMHNNGVSIQVVTKSDDGTYQMLFESENLFQVTITESLENDLAETACPERDDINIEKSVDKAIVSEGEAVKDKNSEKIEQPLEKTEPFEAIEKSESLEILRLQQQNSELKNKVEKLEKLIEVYEEEINKKRSVKGFFGKFFS